MKLKDQRAAQLDELKTGITPAAYIIEYLNSAFLPYKRSTLATRDAAEAEYQKAAETTPAAFLRKYAIFDF